MMRSIEPLMVICGIVALYFASGAWLVSLMAAAKTRRTAPVAIVLVILGTVGGLMVLLPFSRWGRIDIAAATWLAADLACYRLVLKPVMTWEVVKFAREAARQTTLHMILITGSLIFLVPFAWLVVTSLKEESEMSKFPPVWIPTQQVEVKVGGRLLKEATALYRGQRVTVGVVHEYDNGQRAVQIVAPASLAGAAFSALKSDLTAVRHVAPVWKNYPDALKFLPPETHSGLVFLGNTIEISALSIIGTLLSCSMVAYGFARLRWPGRDTLFVVLLGTMMLPGAVTMMPVFLIFRALGWVDTLKPLWAPAFVGSAFNIFLLRQFFLGIPTELEDAAKIDGCSHYTIFWRIMMPQIKPALAALTIMTFMGAWNDFRGPLIYISSPQKEPLAYALQLFQSAHGGEPGMLMAASTMVMVPVLALFFFTQRYFIQGITLTGIKG